MLKRFLTAFLLILIAFLLQTSVFNGALFNLPVPNLLLIITVSLGFMWGPRSGIMIGLVCGLLADLYFLDFVGLNAFLYMSVGYVNGLLNRIFFGEGLRLPVFLVFGSDIVYNFAIYLFLFLFRGRIDIFYYLIHVILPEAVYTAIIAFIIYKPLLILHNKFSEQERRSEENND